MLHIFESEIFGILHAFSCIDIKISFNITLIDKVCMYKNSVGTCEFLILL